MTLSEVRSKYLEFFKARGHAVIPSAPLVPENDPSTLFTGSGMQPLVPYLLGQPHPAGSRLCDSQKCFRSMDIEEVGDNRHTTFFEMLGNWSLGDYFKQEQLPWFFEFLTTEIGLDPRRLYVTVFDGAEDIGVPRDEESIGIWKKLFSERGIDAQFVSIGSEDAGHRKGMQGGRIFGYTDKNWWSRAGAPKHMPAGEPGGPDSEVFYEFADIEHDAEFGEHCHPNCDCGRFLEIGNSVFMQYVKQEAGSFALLPKQNVDFGGGLERIAAAAAGTPDVFAAAHGSIIHFLAGATHKRYGERASDVKSFRIIADHMKAAIFLLADGVQPGPDDQGYFVRRLLRRAVRHADKLGLHESGLKQTVAPVVDLYQDQYPELAEKAAMIEESIAQEEERFRRTLARGMKELERFVGLTKSNITGEEAFTLVTTYGFPIELIQEIAGEKGIRQIDIAGFKELLKEHQDKSRAGSEQKFKGGLADASDKTVRLHTAHHLLLRALQIVLGKEVRQRGSNITGERLRIDFNYGAKMTDEQKKEVERIVNEKIGEDLPVIRTEMSKEEAEKLGAEREFGAKYPERVSVYAIGPKNTQDSPVYERAFSIEFCGGPHVERTGELRRSGVFKIIKEEAVAQGIRRIKAVLE